MVNPTQPPSLFKGLTTNPSFQKDYEIQDTTPIDGSSAALRSYSPFIIRVLPPVLIGDASGNVLTNSPPPPTSSPNGTTRESNRLQQEYATSINSVNTNTSDLTSYKTLANAGGAIPGLRASSVASIRAAYSSAIFQQAFAARSGSGTAAGAHINMVTPAFTNDMSSLSILLQVKEIISTPPLLMLINPTSMRQEHGKVSQFQDRSRYGYIYQAWGNELTKMNFKFTIGAYLCGHSSPSQSTGPSGVQRASRRDSASFQQLMNLLTIYQSSGDVQDVIGGSRAKLMIGNISIEYDQHVYVGRIESFGFTEDEEHQNGGLEIDIDFTVIREFDLALPSTSINPINNPNNYRSGDPHGSLVQNASGSTSNFIPPTIGFNSPYSPPQPWASPPSTPTPTSPSTVNSRR